MRLYGEGALWISVCMWSSFFRRPISQRCVVLVRELLNCFCKQTTSIVYPWSASDWDCCFCTLSLHAPTYAFKTHTNTHMEKEREREYWMFVIFIVAQSRLHINSNTNTHSTQSAFSLSLSLLNNQTTIMYAHVKPHPINKFLEANKIGIELICFPSHIHTHTEQDTDGYGRK